MKLGVKKMLHSTSSPEYGAGMAMRLAETDDGVVTGVREAWIVLTSCCITYNINNTQYKCVHLCLLM